MLSEYEQSNVGPVGAGEIMTPKEKRDAKNARHRRNEQRRTERFVERRYSMLCKLMGEKWMADVMQCCRRR